MIQKNYTFESQNPEELFDNKAGNREYEGVQLMADTLNFSIENYYATTQFQNRPNEEKAIAILIKFREQLYK